MKLASKCQRFMSSGMTQYIKPYAFLFGLGKPNGYLYLIEMNIMRKHNRIKWAHWPTIQTTLVCVALAR